MAQYRENQLLVDLVPNAMAEFFVLQVPPHPCCLVIERLEGCDKALDVCRCPGAIASRQVRFELLVVQPVQFVTPNVKLTGSGPES